MQIKQLTQASGPLWQDAMSLYCEIFPMWEREPIAEIEQAINSGNSRCILLCENDRVLGMSLTELYPQLSFALLGYLFIAPDKQNQGLGKRLCHELFAFFDPHPDFNWLLVEAEPGPESFYQQLGFNTINIDYLSPHYDDQQSTPMALMTHAKTDQALPTRRQLCTIVAHIFAESYYLKPDDPRIEQQHNHILSKDVL